MEHHCYLRSVQDVVADGKTLCDKRFGEPFGGPMIACGAMVEYHTTSAKDQSRLHQVGQEYSSDMIGEDGRIGNHRRRIIAKEVFTPQR